MVKTVESVAPQVALKSPQSKAESLNPSGLWSTELVTGFQQFLQLQTEINASSFRDGWARLLTLTPMAPNIAVDKVLESAGQYPARMEQATHQMCSSFELLAKTQVDWFSRACDNWVEVSRGARASVLRSAAEQAPADRRVSARLISFPERRRPAAVPGAQQALRRTN